MKALLQRVREASVTIDGKVHGKIGAGLLVFLGVAEEDGDKDLEYLLNKVPSFRIFADSDDKMNLCLTETSKEILVISQFTLVADCSKGNRPSFTKAAKAGLARRYYEIFVERLKEKGLKVETGVFAADMKVSLVNDGPVTFLLDSREL